jgi:RND family efflux transporter MFP subunit
MKKLFVIILVLLIGYGAYAWHDHWLKSKASAAAAAKPTTAKVELRSIQFSLTIAGDIGPADQVSVRPEVNGRIAELPVDVGDNVPKGALLCRLDDRDLQTERASAMTEIEGAKLQLVKAERTYKRNQHLIERRLVSQEIFDDTRTEYDLANNALDKAQKSLTAVDDQLSKMRILAPFDATILTRPVSVGQAVSGSGGFNSGTEIMTAANLKEMIISSYVNQADVTRMKVGQNVSIAVEAVTGLKLTGIIERIAPQATVKNGIKGFATQIRLKSMDERVRPGMTANVSIPLVAATNVLAVPLAAVFTDQNDRYVFVKNGGDSFEPRAVELGVSDLQFTEITSGLKNGDAVALVRPASATGTKPQLHPAGTNKLATK